MDNIVSINLQRGPEMLKCCPFQYNCSLISGPSGIIYLGIIFVAVAI